MASLDDINAALKRGFAQKALAGAKALSKRRAKDPYALDALGRAFVAVGDHGKALGTYDRLIKLAPRHVKPLADKRHLQQLLGDMGGAEASLRKALSLAPLEGELLRMLSATARVMADDPVVQRFVSVWRDGSLPQGARMQAGFGLFNALGDAGLPYLHETNALQAKAAPWSAADRDREYNALRAACDAQPWPEASAPKSDARPIFVTGMPRSGTTLVEQSLSCHPQVTGTGETSLPLRAAYSVMQDGARFRPVPELGAAGLGLIAERYLRGMAHFHAPGPVFTDKSINSYLLAGLWPQIMPKARVVVVTRDPRDIGWSIYRNHFATGTHGYSTRLEAIASQIAAMLEMVAYWQDRAPGSFITMRYEDLVRDPEPQIRRLLDYCDLPFDAACLAPEKNPRAVKTLSVDQVRAPISPKAIGGWARYAEDLAPLVRALEEKGVSWD